MQLPDSSDSTLPDDTTLRTWLQACLSIAVVGLSPRPERDSYEVTRVLQSLGWRIVPVNPAASEILGCRSYPDLASAAMHERIDLVNVFRLPEHALGVAREAVAIGAQGLWFQPGTAHPAATPVARAGGLWVVQGHCLKVEARRLGLRLG